jgi:ribose 1,5-bisphosphokinase PhnN
VAVPVGGADVAAEVVVGVVVVVSVSDALLPQPAAKIATTTVAITASERICRLQCHCEYPWGWTR